MHEKPCPKCGHCPTCGRANGQQFHGYWPYPWTFTPGLGAGGNYSTPSMPMTLTSGGGVYS